MTASKEFEAFTCELFAGLGAITVKRMFGGASVYADGVIFAIIGDDVIYLKADEPLQADLEAEGCGPLLWTPKSGPHAGETIPMGYWHLPDAALDDPHEAARWGRRALDVARAKKAKKKTPAKKMAAQAKKRS